MHKVLWKPKRAVDSAVSCVWGGGSHWKLRQEVALVLALEESRASQQMAALRGSWSWRVPRAEHGWHQRDWEDHVKEVSVNPQRNGYIYY